MSEANQAVVRLGYELAARGDWESAPWILAEDARWYSAIGALMGKTVHVGFDEIRRLVVEEIPAVLEGFRPELLEVRELGGDWLLAVVRWRATLRASGMELDQVFGQLCLVRDGRWQELRSYESVEAALAASVALRFTDAFNARDLDALAALCDPDVELHAERSSIEGPYVGHEGIRRWADEMVTFAPEYRLEIHDVRVDGDDLIVLGRQHGTARTGVPVDDALAARVRLRDGLILRVQAGRSA